MPVLERLKGKTVIARKTSPSDAALCHQGQEQSSASRKGVE